MRQAPAVPDCRTPDEVCAYLQQLRTWAGGVSFRELTLRVNAIRLSRNARQTARQTVNDCFQRGRKRLDRDLVLDIARALGLPEASLLRLDQVCQVADGRRSLAALADVSDSIPPGSGEFTGREPLLERALTAVDDAWTRRSQPVVAFTGPAGMGKTELAVQLAHRLSHKYPDLSKRFFVDLHGFDTRLEPTPPFEVLAAIVKLLGVRDSAILALSTVEQMWDRLLDTLAGQRALLLLDNVSDAAHLGRFTTGAANLAVIATSQERLPLTGPGHGIEVGPLDYPSCVRLLDGFDRLGRVSREPGVAVRLINELCGGRPFDLVALGGQLSDPAEAAWSLADHADRLAALPRDEASHPILAGSCHRLEPEIRRVFRLLGLYPGFDFSAYDIAVLADRDVDLVDKFLNRLYDRHLLVRRHAHRFRLHDVVAAYSRRLLHREESPTNQREALRRLHTATTLNANNRLGPRR